MILYRAYHIVYVAVQNDGMKHVSALMRAGDLTFHVAIATGGERRVKKELTSVRIL